jgi:hypothetical protein
MPRDLNRDFALRLAEAGFSIFPCGQDKIPLVKWRTLSTRDPETIAVWWSEFPGALPALDLEKAGLLVLDGDRHGGPDGRAALRELLNRQPDFFPERTPAVLTPGDGVHVYFHQNGHQLGNSRGVCPRALMSAAVVACPFPMPCWPMGTGISRSPGTPDLMTAFQAGSIPPVPEGIIELMNCALAGARSLIVMPPGVSGSKPMPRPH